MIELKREFVCSCGKIHKLSIDNLFVGKGVISSVNDCVKKYNAKKVFMLADKNTYTAAGEKVCKILKDNYIDFVKYVFNVDSLEPDERAVGSAIMHYDYTCDMIIGVGSGVINDIGKILSKCVNKPYVIVATAPSMDGYASASSSMSMDGLKISLSSKSADIIIGDVDILKNAPTKMLMSGLGDMLAKYISICEWRISNVITGEYYCEEIADMVRKSLKKCIDNAHNLLKRDETAVEAVFEGLVICGAAMSYAGLSRPASGVEHYFSHIWDMRGLEFGTPVSTHGIQCAIGTLYAAKIYEKLKEIKPNNEKALNEVKSFDYEKYCEFLRKFLGKGAETMIALESKEGKYDTYEHGKRLGLIIDNWDKITEIISEEIPTLDELLKTYDEVDMPKTEEEIGLTSDIVYPTFCATKDIRDKYVLSRLCWDLGIIDEITF